MAATAAALILNN